MDGFIAEEDLIAGDSVSLGDVYGSGLEFRGVHLTTDKRLSIGVCIRDCKAGEYPNIKLSVTPRSLQSAIYLLDALSDLSAAAQRFAFVGCPSKHIDDAVKSAKYHVAKILKSGRIKE